MNILFSTWRWYVAALVFGYIICLAASGIFRHLGNAERYPLFYGHYGIAWQTFLPSPAYKSVISLTSYNTGDFRPIYEAALNTRCLPHYRMYNTEHLAHFRPSLAAHESTFVYTPFAALLVTPLAMMDLSLHDAAFAINLVNHLLWIGAALMLFLIMTYQQKKSLPMGLLFALQYLSFYPLAKTLQLMQATMIIFFCLALSVFFLQRNKHVAAGLAMALSASIKPHLILALVPLFMNRSFPRRALIASVVLMILTGLASLFYAGIENCFDYVFKMLPTLSRGYAFYPNKGINGLLLRLFTDENQTICNLAQKVPWIMTITSLFGLGLIAAAAFACFSKTKQCKYDNNVICFTTAITAVVLASPVCWEHHLAILAISFCVVVNMVWRNPKLRTRSIDILLLISFLLVSCYFDTQYFGTFPMALLSSLEYYGALLLFGFLVALMIKQKYNHIN